MKKFIVFSVVGLLLIGTFTGCNTMKGAGQDIENAGKGIKKSAD